MRFYCSSCRSSKNSLRKFQVFFLFLLFLLLSNHTFSQTPSISVSPTTVCTGSSVSLNANIAKCSYIQYYQYSTNGGTNWTTISGYAGTCTANHTPLATGNYIYRYYWYKNPGQKGFSSNSTSVSVITTPSAAGTINGSSNVNPGQTSVSYSVGTITWASSYNWSYSGSGTTISGTTNNITIDFASNATSGNLTVQGVNSCGSGTISSNFPITVNRTVAFTTSTQTSPNETNGSTLSITAQLSAPSALDVTIPFTVSGTATSDVDYSISSSPLIITAGNNSADITITIIGDTDTEGDETVIVTMGTPTNASQGATTSHTATITDDDVPTVNFTTSSQSSVGESGIMTITAQLSETSPVNVSIPYTLSGTASGGGIDYTITASPLIINAGATSGNITITIQTDALDEDDETVIVTMGNPTNAIKGTTDVHTATITDDDTPPTVTLSSSTSSIIENGGSTTITATLSAESGRDVTIDLGFTGTATGSGTDYTASASQIVISAGSTTGNITITGVDDSVYEGANETVIVDITSVTNGTESGTQQETISIIEDESIPTVTLSVSPDVINENGGSSTVTATLSNYTTQNVTVNFSFSGTATGGGTDYTASASQVTINSGSLTNTFTITAVDDGDLYGDITVIIDIISVTNATENGTQQETITIADDESAPFGSIAVDRTSPENGYTPQQLVENILVTGCLTASNITFTGNSSQIGYFTKGTSSFPIDEGIILSTGNVQDAEGPNDNYNTYTSFSTAAQSSYFSSSYDVVTLEFDFVPAGDQIEFNYVFASEEYAEFVLEDENDAFAFLISGPGITGEQNIALIPGSSDIVSINTVHGPGYILANPDQGTAYPTELRDILPYPSTYGHTWSTINDDTNGYFGTSPNRYYYQINPTIDNTEPAANSSYYVDNGHFTDGYILDSGTGRRKLQWTNGNGSSEMEFDGRTTLLTASSSVTACETYHIRIILVDRIDSKWDSGVFLEGRSFTSNEVQISSQIEGISSDAEDMFEGCDGSFIRFQRAAGADNSEVLNFPIVLSGTATNGVDYIYTNSSGTIIGDGTFPSSATLNSGVDYIDYYYKAQSDGSIEGNETIIFKVNNSCPCDVTPTYFETTVTIIDVPQIVTSTTEVIQCQAAGNPVATITVNMENGLDANDYTYSLDGATPQASNIFTITATQPDGSDIVGTSHYITVSDQYSCNEVTEYNIIIPDIAPFDANAGSDITMCEGQSGIQLSASGGIYYVWSSSPASGTSYLSSTTVANPTVLSTIPPGSYTFTVTAQDQPGASPACQGTDDMILTVNQAPDIVVTANDYAVCDGTAIQLNAAVTNGGSSPTYSWNPTNDLSSSTIYNPVYTPSVSSYLSQSFTVTVTGDNGCTASAGSSIIEVFPDPVITTTSTNNASCSSSSDGSATVSASSPGTSPAPTFSYQWDTAAGSQTGATATGLAAGTYTVTATDNTNGCTNTHQVTIGTDPDIESPIINSCLDATITLDQSGNWTITAEDIAGSIPYTDISDNCSSDNDLIISLSQYTFNTSNVGENTVTLTVEDEAGNSSTCNATVTVNYPTTCNISGSTTIWLEDFPDTQGTQDDPLGEWTTSVNTSNFSVQSNAMRSLNQNGSYWQSKSIDITGWTNLNIKVDTWETNKLGSTDYIKFEYSIDGGSFIPFPNPINGIYYDDIGGNSTSPNYACTSTPNGSNIVIKITVKDNNKNSSNHYFDNVHVTGDPNITITPVVTDISCNGLTDGSITVNASGAFTPYQYKLDAVYTSYQSSNVFSNLPAGTYTATVKGTHSTIVVEKSADPVTITEPAADPTLQELAVSDASSCNPADGDIYFTITNAQSGVTYELQTTGGASLSPAVTAVGTGSNLDLTILQANIPGTTTTYQVHATSSTGCSELTLADQPILTVYNTPAPTGSTSQSFCSSDIPRVSNISITGSSIIWYTAPSGGSTVSPTSLLVDGTTYYASQTLNGCESQTRLAVSVTVTATPTIHTVTHGTVCGTGTTTIYATANSGAIDWYSAQTGGTLLATATGSYTTPNLTTPGKYSYWVESVSNGCVTPTRSEVYVNVYTLPAITLGSNPVVCKGTTSTDLTYSGTAGTPNQYAIDFDGTAEGFGFVDVSYTSLPASPISITVPGGAIAGTYNATLTVKNTSNGCVSNDYSITVRVIEVSISESITDVTCSGYSNGEIDITVSGGDTPYTFAWTTSDGSGLVPTDEDQTELEEGTYDVTVTDANGCEASGSYTVSNVPDNINPEINFSTPQDSIVIAITSSESATDVSIDFTAFDDGSGARNVNPVETDNCNVLKYTYDQSGATNIDSPLTGINTISTQSFNLGETVISWEATDGSTNTASKTQLVYAARANQFVVNCAADETLGCNPSTFTKTNPTYTLPTWLTTLIGNSTVTLDTTMTTTLNAASGTECEVTRTRTYSVSFNIIFEGSTIASVTQSCDQTYTYTIDTEDPVTSCVTDQSVNTDSGECNYTHSGTAWDATATDNCNVASIGYVLTGATTGSGSSLDGIDFNTGTTTVTWTATDDCGNTNECSYTVTVGENLSISTQPQNETVCEGSNVTFTITASADSGTPTYQWQLDSGSGFADISGETSSSLSLSSVTTGMSTYQYRVVVTGTCSEDEVTSNAATLTVNANVTASASIADSPSGTICAGTSVTFTATPTNGGAGPTYQWYKNSSPLSGETGSTYTTTTLADGDQIYVIMTSNADCVTGSPATSNTITADVNNSSVGGTVTGGTSPICQGSSTGTLTLSGHTGSIVRWEKRVDAGSWQNAWNSGSTTFSETPYPTGTWEYRAVVQNGICDVAYSSTATIQVDPTTQAGWLSGSNAPKCEGEAISTLTLNGHTGDILRWEKRVDAESWIPISNTTTTFSETPSSAGTWDYRAVIQSGSCNTEYTSPITIVINDELTITLGSTPEICRGETIAGLTYTATTGDPDSYSVDFDAAANSAGLTDFSNYALTASPLSIGIPWNIPAGTYNGTLTVGTNYPVCSSQGYSFSIIVKPLPSAPSGSSTQSFCSGDTPTISDISVTGSNITWYDASSAGNVISGSSALSDGTTYYASQSVDGCESSSRLAVTVNVSDLAFQQLMFVDEVCSGDNTGQILVELTGGAPSYDISILNGSSSEVASYTASSGELHLFENLPPDSYTVNVVDNESCTLSYTGLISGPEELSITLNSSTNNPCSEDENGSIDIDVSGGSQGNYFLFDENEGSGTDAGTRIDVPYYNELSIRYSGTLECWVKFRNAPQDYAVFVIKGDTQLNEKYSLQLFNKQLCLTLHKGTTGDLSDYTYITGGSNPFPTGEWHHVAGTWDVDPSTGTGDMFLYLDGVEVATTTITTSDLPNTSGSETAPLMIGRQYTNSSAQYYRFDGYIRDVRVWDYKRSRIELLSTMYSSLNGSESGLAAYLPVQDGTGTTISNNVTISGANDGAVANGSSDYWETGYQFSWVGPNDYTAATEDISDLASGQYTVTVTDINACETTAQYEITSTDAVDPIISNCPSNMNVNVDNGLCSAVVSWTIPTATDNCSVQSFTVSSSALETITESVSGTHQATISVGTSTITYTATDSNGNTATCQFNITVADNEDPVIGSCPSNTTVSTIGDIPAAETSAGNIATDNCGLNTISHVDVTSLSCPRTVTRTYTVTDIHGNSATCDQVITISNASCIDANLCSTTLGSNLISGSPTSGTGTLYTETISVCASTTYEIKFDVSGTSPFDFDISLDGDLVNDDDMYNSGSTYGFKFQSSSSASNVALSLINNDTNSLTVSNLSFAHCGPSVSAVISTQPECTGSLAELTATVTGGGSYVYQWQESSNGGSSWTNLSNGANVSGATTTTISFTTWTEGNLYHIVVSETSAGLSDENCSIQSNTLSINPSDSDAPVYQEAFKNGIDPIHSGGNYALSACDDATNTFSQLALDATDVIDNCSAFGDLILTYSITNGINDLTDETGDASSYSFPVGSSTVTYQAEDVNGNVATFTFTVVISDLPVTTSISTDGTAVTDGSGYRPYQASTHTYTVDGGSATSGSTYTWKVVDKDDTELTTGTASTYSIDTSNPAAVIITWGGSIPLSGNDYKIIVRETNSTSGCYTEKELTVTILENIFNATVVDRGDACHTPQSSTTLIDWLINKTGGTNTWYFSYKIFIDNVEINYASEGISPIDVEVTGSSFTLNYLYGNVTDAQKTLRLEIYDVYDTYESPETNTGDNSDEVTLYERPAVQF